MTNAFMLSASVYDKHKNESSDPYSSQRGLAPLRLTPGGASIFLFACRGHVGHTYDKFSLHFFPFLFQHFVVSTLAFEFIELFDVR